MFGLPKSGKGIGFHRLLEFCTLHNIDLELLAKRSLVVTGSNGKGSTCRFAYRALMTHFDRVGCFTSPHLFELNERFELSGQRIPAATLNEYVRVAMEFQARLQQQPESDSLGSFELLFLVGLLWFTTSDAECVVWEAGIGGRYDPVRVLRSDISALTSIDLEHTELLGSTKELIAFDKLDATRPGGLTVVSPSVDADLTQRLRAYARISGKELLFVSECASIDHVKYGRDGTQYTMRLPQDEGFHQVSIPLIGIHQAHNSATALHMVEAYLQRRGEQVDTEKMIDGIASADWPGRLQLISSDPEIWIDVGHTPEALEVTIRTLKHVLHDREPIVVVGVSANKAVREVVSLVERHFTNVIVTRAYKNGEDAETLASLFADRNKILEIAPTIERAVESAVSWSKQRQQPIVVLGGLFLAIEFEHAFRGQDPRTLDFF